MDESATADSERQGSDGPVSILALPLILLVQLYQVTLRPVMGGHCRFQPTCSAYSIEALRTHGAVRGTWLMIRRILRCHPWGGCGYDPVPKRKTEILKTENRN